MNCITALPRSRITAVSAAGAPRSFSYRLALRTSLASALLAVLALSGLVFLSAETSKAEIIQTSAGVLQSSDRRAKLIISHRVPGIFILLGSPIDLQIFDPAQIELPAGGLNASGAGTSSSSQGAAVKGDSVTHLFVEYSPQLDRYTALHVGERSFRIRGGFSLHSDLGGQRLRVTVDNNNPYLSVVYEPLENTGVSPSPEDGSAVSLKEPSIVGFRGIQTVVNKSGLRYVALLEANQFNQFKGLIEPYGLHSGVLTLKGKEYSGSSIGVELEPQKNLCLTKGSSLIYQTQLSAIKGSSNREAALKELEGLLKASPSKDPFKGVLLLRINPTEILGLDYNKERVITVRPLPKAKQSICLVEEIPLG
jgi:hypothetical protein